MLLFVKPTGLSVTALLLCDWSEFTIVLSCNCHCSTVYNM